MFTYLAILTPPSNLAGWKIFIFVYLYIPNSCCQPCINTTSNTFLNIFCWQLYLLVTECLVVTCAVSVPDALQCICNGCVTDAHIFQGQLLMSSDHPAVAFQSMALQELSIMACVIYCMIKLMHPRVLFSSAGHHLILDRSDGSS